MTVTITRFDIHGALCRCSSQIEVEGLTYHMLNRCPLSDGFIW